MRVSCTIVLAVFTVAFATAAKATSDRLSGQFAYATHSGDIWVVKADGSSKRQLTHSGGGFDFKPTWSPDGKEIAFATTRGKPPLAGDTSIFVINVDGTHARQLTLPSRFRFGGSEPAWAPDGKWIAFASAHGLALISPMSGQVKLLNLRGDAPAWSPNSTQIIYTAAVAGGAQSNPALYMVSLRGGKPRQLTKNHAFNFPGPFSPDGKKIAYLVQDRNGAGHTYLMNSDGSQTKQVTQGAGTQFTSDWLANGQLLVGISKPRQRTPSWYLMAPDGTHLKALPQLAGATVAAWHR